MCNFVFSLLAGSVAACQQMRFDGYTGAYVALAVT